MLYFFEIKTNENEVFAWMYDDLKQRLYCLQSIYPIGNPCRLNNNEHDLLLFYLKHKDQIFLDEDIEKKSLEWLGRTEAISVSQYRTKLKKILCNTSYHNCPNIKIHKANDLIFKRDLPQNDKHSKFTSLVWSPSEELLKSYELKKKKDVVQLYQLWVNSYQLQSLENKVKYINMFNDLLKEIPEESSVFYRIDDLVLPFIVPQQNRILFPMKIENSPIKIKDKNHQDSLLLQRKVLYAKLYNGNIFRLVKQNINTGVWTLARSTYFDILDSSDYISSRLKAYYQQYIEYPDHKSKEQFMTILNIWKNRLKQIMLGDFSHYSAGLAFSIPTFRILDNGGLQLLCAKGSQHKATGSGKMHVCPAGMLEFWGMTNISELTFKDFKSIATKELFEETVLSDQALRDIATDTLSPFKYYLDCFTDSGDPDKLCANFSTIDLHAEELIKQWDQIWLTFKKKVPSLDAVKALRGLKDSHTAFMVIDALNFRPEIIQPIYIYGALNQLVNWEYDHESVMVVTWENLQELNQWVKENYIHWCAPGLSAAYLGAKQYFENTQRYQSLYTQ